MAKEAWGNFRNIFAANTTARKLQLHHELNAIQQRDMSIANYTLKIKELSNSLSSINVNIDDDKMVQICLGRLAPCFGAIRTTVLTRENHPSFDLQLMLLVEGNHVQTKGKYIRRKNPLFKFGRRKRMQPWKNGPMWPRPKQPKTFPCTTSTIGKKGEPSCWTKPTECRESRPATTSFVLVFVCRIRRANVLRQNAEKQKNTIDNDT